MELTQTNDNLKFKTTLKLLFKTKQGRKFFLWMLILQSLCSSIILFLQIINARYKISSYINFNSFIFDIFGYNFIVPLLSFDENGAFIFKVIVSSFFAIIAAQLIQSKYFDFKEKILTQENLKKIYTSEDSNDEKELKKIVLHQRKSKKNNSQLKFLLISIPFLIFTDLIRDFLAQIDHNLQLIMMMKFTFVAFFIINFLKFVNGGLRRILSIIDGDIKDGKFLKKDSNKHSKFNLKNNFAYMISVGVITIIPSISLVGLNYLLNNFEYLTSLKVEIHIFSIDLLILSNARNTLIFGILSKLILDIINRFIEFNDDFYRKKNNTIKISILEEFLKSHQNNNDSLKSFCEKYIEENKDKTSIKPFEDEFKKFISKFIKEHKEENFSEKDLKKAWEKDQNLNYWLVFFQIKELKEKPNFENIKDCVLTSIASSAILATIVTFNISFMKNFNKIFDHNKTEAVIAVILILSATILLTLCQKILVVHNNMKKDEKEFQMLDMEKVFLNSNQNLGRVC